MSAAAQIWVELSARDTGFNAFLERMDKKLSTVGGTAEQVWMNSRTAAEKYLATLREIERLNTTVDIKSQKTFISDDTAERARIEARRNAASAVGVDESSWERYQRQLQELADAHQRVGFSVEELRRAQTRFREEYQNANPIFAQAERLMRSNATAAENYARQLAEISRLETTRNPLTGQNFIDGDTATRAHQAAQRRLVEGLGGEYENYLERFSRRQQEVQALFDAGTITAQQYRSVLRDIMEEYNRSSPAVQQFNQQLAREQALLNAMRSPIERYQSDMETLRGLWNRGEIDAARFNQISTILHNNMTVNNRQFEAGKHGIANWNNLMFQASYAVQDFAQVANQGLGASLRASANNISMVAMQLGGLSGALAGAALTVGGMWLASWLDSEKAIDKNTEAIDRFKDRLKLVLSSIGNIKEAMEFNRDAQKKAENADAGGLKDIQAKVKLQKEAADAQEKEAKAQLARQARDLPLKENERGFLFAKAIEDDIRRGGKLEGPLFSAISKDMKDKLIAYVKQQSALLGDKDRLVGDTAEGFGVDAGIGMKRIVDRLQGASGEGIKALLELTGKERKAGLQSLFAPLGKERAEELVGAFEPLIDELQKAERESKKFAENLEKVERLLKKVGNEKRDLPGVAGDMPAQFFADLPKEDFNDIRAGRFKHAQAATKKAAEELAAGRFKHAQAATKKAAEELADAAREKMFAGRPGGDKMAKILEDLDKGQKNVVAGMQGQDRVNGLTAVQDAANAQLDALQRQLQTGLDSRDARQQKAAFLGAEEFSKQIQTGAIETKAEKAQRETANNTKKMIEEIVKTRESIEKSKGAVFGGK